MSRIPPLIDESALPPPMEPDLDPIDEDELDEVVREMKAKRMREGQPPKRREKSRG